MEQQFDYPKSESELRYLQDELYAKARTATEQGRNSLFKGLLELISSEATILTAIHNVKANKGSNTAGSDSMTMQEDVLEKDYDTLIVKIKKKLQSYKPAPVRRVYIPKPGKGELRPLGIPSIIDRIIQECVRLILEPIVEAQFFTHSYGFPTVRYQGMMIGVTSLIFSKYFGPFFRNPEETPYSKTGRNRYMQRTGKKPLRVRADELLTLHRSQLIAHNKAPSLYNFEYLLNRAYAFNRDKGKCRICSEPVDQTTVHFHHINPHLPLHLVNKVANLATLHIVCHKRLHRLDNLSELPQKVIKKILGFREKLGM